MDELSAELQEEIELAVMGEPMSRFLGARVQTAARTVLHRHGHDRARVSVKPLANGFEVVVVLPPAQGRAVKQLVLRVGQA